jgi:hypothetical protein
MERSTRRSLVNYAAGAASVLIVFGASWLASEMTGYPIIVFFCAIYAVLCGVALTTWYVTARRPDRRG